MPSGSAISDQQAPFNHLYLFTHIVWHGAHFLTGAGGSTGFGLQPQLEQDDGSGATGTGTGGRGLQTGGSGSVFMHMPKLASQPVVVSQDLGPTPHTPPVPAAAAAAVAAATAAAAAMQGLSSQWQGC